MRRVLKYRIPVDGNSHEIPALIGDWHIGQQDDESVTIWQEDWAEKPDRTVVVRVVGTGHEFDGTYLGTVRGFARFGLAPNRGNLMTAPDGLLDGSKLPTWFLADTVEGKPRPGDRLPESERLTLARFGSRWTR